MFNSYFICFILSSSTCTDVMKLGFKPRAHCLSHATTLLRTTREKKSDYAKHGTWQVRLDAQHCILDSKAFNITCTFLKSVV